jgi:U3 small nucleolar RNA-associated protein 25
MRGGKMKKSSGPRRNRKEHRDRKEKRMSRHGGTSAPIHMSASDRKYMKDFGELHPIHEKTDDDGDASVKRKKIDFTKPEPRRHPHEKAKPGSRHGAIEVKEVEKGDAEDDYEEFAEGNTAYSALLSTIRPRGRFAAILQSMKEDEAQEEEDKEEEDEDDEDDEEESQSGDDDSSQEEDEDANSLEDGDDVSNSNDDDDDEDDEDDDEDDEDDESEDGVMTSDPEEAEAEAEAGADEPQEKESESEGVARNAALHDHFDQAFDDKTAPKFAKFLQSMQSGKEKKESIELQSPSFETAILHSGYGAYKRAINSLPSSTPATKLRPNLRWWARKNEKTPKPDEISNVDFSPMQSELFSMMDSYKDVYLPQWSHENADEIRETYVIHALNHALKVRNIVQKNDERIKAAQASGRDCEVQDSGFTRPRVLIVVPYRFCAFKIVNMMIRLLVDPNAPKVERSVKSQNRCGRLAFVSCHDLHAGLRMSLVSTPRKRLPPTSFWPNSLTAMQTTAFASAFVILSLSIGFC